MENRGGVEVMGHETGNDYTFDTADGVGGTMNGTASTDGFSVTWE